MIVIRNLFWMVCIVSVCVFAQVEDSFEYESLESSIWSGNTNFFQISNGMLRSNGPNAVNQKIFVSTPNALIDSTEWNFLVDLSFNPTGTTFVRVYLTSDQPNLAQALNGYYIQYGQTNDDFLRFFRQQGSTNTLLFTGNQSFTGNIKVRIRVTRDKEGNWEFFTDRTGGNNLSSEGKVKEDVLKTTQHFGFYCEYSTASRFNMYYFDDVVIRNIVKDTVRPVVQSVTVLNNNSIQVRFSEVVEKTSAENLANYSLDGFTLLSANRGVNDSSLVTLVFNQAFENPRNYNLTISNIKDLAGNEIITNSAVSFLNFTPFARSLIINELMPDPDPVVGLPNAEFIEIFNPNNFSINIGNWKLSKGTTDVNIPNANIPSNGYLILCSTSNVAQFRPFGNTLGVPSIPALVNAGDRIILKSPSGLVVDEVIYRDTWYRDSQKRNGGWSLEQINPNSPCSGASNWTASVDPSGGTPGKINSVFDLTTDATAPNLISQSLKGRDSLLLVFDEPLDTASIKTPSNFSIEENSVRAVVMESDFSRWWVLLQSPIDQGLTYQMQVNGIKDCSGNLSNTFQFSFGLGKTPTLGEILITEIMADETPVVGLPEAEFVEIWNRTDQVLSLDGVYMNDGGTSRANFPSGSVLLPNEYAIVCGSTRGNLFTSFGKVFALSSFPSLTNSGKSLFLRRADNELIDQVTYSDTWYRDAVKRDGGWTLELINPNQNCLGGVNWIASVDPSGGTPGRINSVNSAQGFIEKLNITSLSLSNDSTLVVNFSQNIDQALTVLSENYVLDGVTVKSITASNQAATLNISRVETGSIYSITIKGLKDCVGNPMDDFSGSFGRGRTAEKFEILITEIMADETPVVGLPEAEFVEIYNSTNDVLNLESVSFTDGRSFARFPNGAVIFPKEYVIITSTTRASLFESFGRVFGLSSFPSLTNSGKLIYLQSSQKGVLHAVEYSDRWYESNQKKEGGWTLEMVDTQNPCKGDGNWTSAVHPSGGTPGKTNSVAASNPDQTPPQISLAFASNANTLVLKANEPLDSLSIVQTKFTWPQNTAYSTTSVQSFGIFNQEIELKTNFDFLPKTIYSLQISGLKDCVGNLMPDKTIPINLTEPDEKGDVLLSEVLFDPRTGGNDFVEIYNASGKFINLSGWSLARLRDGLVDSKHPIASENLLLKPGQHLAITDNAQNIKDNYPRTPDSTLYQANRIPSYLADSSTVLLFNNRDSLVQRFSYDRRFHHPMIDDRKGVSLERVSFSLSENLPENWHSAAANVGYATPGLPNSQQRNYGLNIENNFEVNPRVISPDNDGWDDFAFLNYRFDQTGYMGSIQVLDSKGRIVKHILRNELMGTEGVFKWDGSDDMGNKAPVGYYVFHIEVFNLNGTTQTIRKPVAVYFGRN